MRTTTLLLPAFTALLSACGGEEEVPPAPTPTETVQTCESIRKDIVTLADQNGVTIVKIYDPTTIKSDPKKVSCSGRAVLGDSQEAKIYYRAYEDEEGDWLVQYAEVPLD